VQCSRSPRRRRAPRATRGSRRSTESTVPAWRPRHQVVSPTLGGSSRTAPLSGRPLPDLSNIRSGARSGAPSPPPVNVGRVEPFAVTRSPHAAFHRRSNVTPRRPSRQTGCFGLQHDHEALTSAGPNGPPSRLETDRRTSPRETVSWRVAAKNANTPPAGNRCPATDSPSKSRAVDPPVLHPPILPALTTRPRHRHDRFFRTS